MTAVPKTIKFVGPHYEKLKVNIDAHVTLNLSACTCTTGVLCDNGCWG